MKKIIKVISISTLMLLFFALNMIVDKNEEKEINYKGLAMTIDGEAVEELPAEGYYYLNSTCDGGNLTWDIYNRTLKLKGDGSLNYSSCKLDFESIDLKIYINGVESNNLPTTEGYSVSSNCGDAKVTYVYPNQLSVIAESKPEVCEIYFLPKLTKVMLDDNTAQSDVNIDYGYTSEGASSVLWAKSTNKNIENNFLIKDGINKKVKFMGPGNIYDTDESQVTNGLYYTSDLTKTENSVPVYFYRGVVENNYVVFGGYCWRIVRTVEDGTIRLRYGGSPTQNGETYICPQTGTAVNIGTNQQYFTSDSNKNDVNYKTSSIRTTVENWYRDNIWKNGQNTKVTNLIADTAYCNDMSEPTTTNEFGAHDRLLRNKSPQYKCPSSTYAYTVAKGDLTYPVGLLTADEVAYAGGASEVNNESYYLYTGEAYWTMSPFYFSPAYMCIIYIDGNLSQNNTSNTYGSVVPVISLIEDAKVKKGTGLYNDPYIIYTN